MMQNSADESSEDVELHAGNKGGDSADYNSDSLTSRSSGFESLPKGEPLGEDRVSVGSSFFSLILHSFFECCSYYHRKPVDGITHNAT